MKYIFIKQTPEELRKVVNLIRKPSDINYKRIELGTLPDKLLQYSEVQSIVLKGITHSWAYIDTDLEHATNEYWGSALESDQLKIIQSAEPPMVSIYNTTTMGENEDTSSHCLIFYTPK